MTVKRNGPFSITNRVWDKNERREARQFFLDRFGNMCQHCKKIHVVNGQEVVPQIHHKDGDNKNNSYENLEWMCPNAHSLTDSHSKPKGVKYTEEEIVETAKKARSFNDLLKRLGIKNRGLEDGTVKRIKRIVDKYKVVFGSFNAPNEEYFGE